MKKERNLMEKVVVFSLKTMALLSTIPAIISLEGSGATDIMRPWVELPEKQRTSKKLLLLTLESFSVSFFVKAWFFFW